MMSNPSRSGIQKRVQIHRKESCENCGGTHWLGIHHRDGNWKNNDLSNLATLCASCHTSLHHDQGDMPKKKKKPPCLVCGKLSTRQDLCATHLSRLKRHGSPYLRRVKSGRRWLLVSDLGIPNGRTFPV
jgi:hypothetical protein